MFGSQLSGSSCGCGCGPIIGVRYCGFFGPNPSSIAQYVWNAVTGLTDDIVQNYIDQVNAYDMSSIPPGYMRLLGHDGNYTSGGAGTGTLDGTTFDYQLTPSFFGTVSPCAPSSFCSGTGTDFSVVDPFFQGAPQDSGTGCCHGLTPVSCSLTPNSFIGLDITYGFESTTGEYFLSGYFVNAIVRCQIVYAESGTSGAMQEFDYMQVVAEDIGGVDAFAVCMGQPSYMTKLSCSTETGGSVVNIPIPPLASLPAAGPSSPEGKIFKATYWFAGDDCSDDP